MVGTVIDDGAYAASMTGDYDKDSNTIRWITNAKGATGKPIVQETSVNQKSANERVLVLSVPGKQENEFTKFMTIDWEENFKGNSIVMAFSLNRSSELEN